ncbi:MAG: anion permease [Firmicutes bacterium]|nr:anion permease [Bacillota bacterium]
MAESKKKVDVKYIIWVAIGLIIMFLGGKIVPMWGPMTEQGVAMLCVFVGLLVLITATGELIWPSCAAFIATILCGYMNAATASMNFIGTSVILQMIAVNVICSALRETGAGQVLAKKMLSAKFVQGKPLMFTAFFLITFLIADVFLSTFGGIIFSFAVFDSIIEALDLKKDEPYVQMMTLGLYLAGMLGSSMLPFSGMVLGITNAFNAAVSPQGYNFNAAVYIICALIVGIVFMIVFSLSMKIFKCDMSKIKDLDVTTLPSLKDVSTKFSKRQIILLCSFIFGIAYSFALLLIPKSLPWYAKFASITQAGWFVLVIVILSIVKVDGKPLMNAAKHFKEGAIWGFIMTVGMFSIIGGALSNNDLGFKTWLTETLQPMFSNMSLPVYILLIVAVCAVVTNFFSNMATGVIVSSLTAPFTIAFAQSGVNVSVIATAIAFSSMFAYITYAAAGPAPIFLGKEGITPKFVWTKGLAMLPVYIIVATVLFSLMGLVL